MKPMPDLDALLKRAVAKGIFGTKMRSVIDAANPKGIAAVVDQQFEVGRQILAHDLVPIIEPEVTISIPDKAAAEDILLAEIKKHLDGLPAGKQVMLKLTLPTKANLYKSLIDDPRVMRVVALSGGYPRDEANANAEAERRHDRQLLARIDRGPVGEAERCRVQRSACFGDRQHFRRIQREGRRLGSAFGSLAIKR